MSKLQAEVRKPEPITFLLTVYLAGTSGWQSAPRSDAIPRICQAGEALWPRACHTRKNAHCISGTHEFRSGEPKAGSDCRPCRAGSALRESSVHHGRDSLSSKSCPFLLFHLACADRQRSAGLAARSISRRPTEASGSKAAKYW